MRTIKLFIFFTVKSWKYQEGNRIKALPKFWTAWKHFYAIAKGNK